MSEGTVRTRRVELLVPPLVTFAGVVVLLLAARFNERLPVQIPPCGFRATFGIPCVGCGGTRAMKTLASGQLLEAMSFNPAVVTGVFVSVVWAIAGIIKYRRRAVLLSVPEQNRRIKRGGLIVLGLLALNWVYLILFLK